MTKLFAALGVVASLFLSSMAFAGDVYVNGHYRSDGTYVQPHYRSAPDGNPYNNYSTKGNVNPYTGQPGTKNPNTGYGSGYGSYGYQPPKTNSYSNPYDLYGSDR